MRFRHLRSAGPWNDKQRLFAADDCRTDGNDLHADRLRRKAYSDVCSVSRTSLCIWTGRFGSVGQSHDDKCYGAAGGDWTLGEFGDIQMGKSKC